MLSFWFSIEWASGWRFISHLFHICHIQRPFVCVGRGSLLWMPRSILANIKVNHSSFESVAKENIQNIPHTHTNHTPTQTGGTNPIFSVRYKRSSHTKSQAYLASTIYDMNIVYFISYASLPAYAEPWLLWDTFSGFATKIEHGLFLHLMSIAFQPL